MKIALIGYGKMGKAIEQIALERGHAIVLKIDETTVTDFNESNLQNADVAIEFTNPHSAVENIIKCMEWGVPVVSGTTGWLKDWNTIESYCKEKSATLLYASNFSIGVNLFFEINKYVARLMAKHAEYNIAMEEIHHTQKKDAPSGTAITLAEQILENNSTKKSWINDSTDDAAQLSIISKRIDPAAGTHSIKYTSVIDDIEIIHTAHNRTGFASGAVLAAEFIANKKGIFTMKDVLSL